MSITPENIEFLLFELVEGNLSPEEEAQVIAYTEEHPYAAEMLDEMMSTVLVPDERIQLSNKEELKESTDIPLVNLDNYEEMILLKMEGELDGEHTSSYKNFMQFHTEKQQDEKLFSLTQLTPEESLVYPRKSELKKTAPIISIARYAVPIAAAASVLLFLFTGPGSLGEGSIAGVSNDDADTTKPALDQTQPPAEMLANSDNTEVASEEDPAVQTAPQNYQNFAPVQRPSFTVPGRMEMRKTTLETGLRPADINTIAFNPSTNIEPALEGSQDTTKGLHPSQKQIMNYEMPNDLTAYAAVGSNSTTNERSAIIGLAERGIESITRQETVIKREETEDQKRFFLKIGKFEINSIRRKKK